MKLQHLFKTKKFIAILNPLPPVGGLAITDTSLRFLALKGKDKFFTASLRLPPGIIEAGRINDFAQLVGAMKALHLQIAPAKQSVHAVVSLPPNLVYTQSFDIPMIAEDKLEEASKLNLQMNSPIDFDKAYSGWQKIGEKFSEGGQIEILGSFVESAIVDEYAKVFEEANFLVVAVEFPALSLSRLVARGSDLSPTDPYIVIDVSGDGIMLMLLRNLNLYFSHFHVWQSIREELGVKNLSQSDLEGFLIKEIQKLLNFYSGRWGDAVKTIILIAPNVTASLTKMVETNFSIEVKNLTVDDPASLDVLWFPALGSALRGLTPRFRDAEISLTSAPVQTRYWQARLMTFASWWRNIAIAVVIFIFFVIGGVDIFLMRQETYTKEKAFKVSQTELDEVARLGGKAKIFNDKVVAANRAKAEVISYASLFMRLEELSGSQVFINRIAVDKPLISVGGNAKDDKMVLQFRARLLAEPIFTEVTLPLHNIKENADGSVAFSVTFKLNSTATP